MRGSSAQTRSPTGKFGGAGGRGCGCDGAQWRRMSLPAMLLGENVLEIVQASQFARDIIAVAGGGGGNREQPRTPKPTPRARKATTAEVTPLRARRAREKQSQRGAAAAEATTPPSRGRVRSRIQFKPVSPLLGRPSVSANRVSPKNRPWAKKTVMFPNPMFHGPTPCSVICGWWLDQGGGESSDWFEVVRREVSAASVTALRVELLELINRLIQEKADSKPESGTLNQDGGSACEIEMGERQ